MCTSNKRRSSLKLAMTEEIGSLTDLLTGPAATEKTQECPLKADDGPEDLPQVSATTTTEPAPIPQDLPTEAPPYSEVVLADSMSSAVSERKTKETWFTGPPAGSVTVEVICSENAPLAALPAGWTYETVFSARAPGTSSTAAAPVRRRSSRARIARFLGAAVETVFSATRGGVSVSRQVQLVQPKSKDTKALAAPPTGLTAVVETTFSSTRAGECETRTVAIRRKASALFKRKAKAEAPRETVFSATQAGASQTRPVALVPSACKVAGSIRETEFSAVHAGIYNARQVILGPKPRQPAFETEFAATRAGAHQSRPVSLRPKAVADPAPSAPRQPLAAQQQRDEASAPRQHKATTIATSTVPPQAHIAPATPGSNNN